MTKKKEVKELENGSKIELKGVGSVQSEESNDIKIEVIEDLEKELGIEKKEEVKEELKFSAELVKQNFLTALEEKYPKQIKEAEKKILDITAKGGQFVNIGDKIAPYFVVKYGWKQQRHLIIIC